MGETCWTEAMTSFCLLLFIASPILGLPSGEVQAQQANGTGPEKTTDCDHFLCIRFAYVRTDSEGYATYSYTRSYNGQTLTYYLHFYDEGLFYNGFWVVNDLETGYVETEGRVFIYNSENDYCPETTYNYWYFWKNGDWVYNTGIYLQTC